jgi:hypothetical protein
VLIVELPQLPRVSVLDGKTFETVVLCRLVSLCGHKRRLNLSQRQVLSLFNRSNQRTVGNYLAKARHLGLLAKVQESSGTLADTYTRGPYFDRDNTEVRAMVTLSHSLWGKGGLLREWSYPSAWGYGCIPRAAIICLAVLQRLDESISKKSMKKYLEPLVSDSSFKDAIRFLTDNHLIYIECGRYALVSDWRSKVELWLEVNAACNERQSNGDARRRAESAANVVRVAQGKLTQAERHQILALPCVFKGCHRRATQQEHFPPTKYLKHLPVSTHRRLVWAICRKHNRLTADFIKSMPDEIPLTPSLLSVRQGTDPLRIYCASANRWISKFYSAVSRNDHLAAYDAVCATFSLWLAVLRVLDNPTHQISTWPHGTARTKGLRCHQPDASQLPLLHFPISTSGESSSVSYVDPGQIGN